VTFIAISIVATNKLSQRITAPTEAPV
jgi:hypothetical protein